MNTPAPTAVPHPEVEASPRSCAQCKQVQYCCHEHRELHSARHAAFCSANAAHVAASDLFRTFASECCHAQLLAAELVADSAVRGALPAEWAEEYQCAAWPDIVVLPLGTGAADKRRARAHHQADCRAGRELLLRALRAGGYLESARRHWLPPGLWEKLVGLATQNSFVVTVESPVRNYLEGLLSHTVAVAKRGDANASEWLRKYPKLPQFARDTLRAALRWKRAHGDADTSDSDEDSESEQEARNDDASGDDAAENAESEQQQAEQSDQNGRNEQEKEENGQRECEGSDDEQEAMSISPESPLAQVASDLATAFNALPECEASALYPVGALINHSCEPNAELEWNHHNTCCDVVALRPLREGEEVTHSYINRDTVRHFAAQTLGRLPHAQPFKLLESR